MKIFIIGPVRDCEAIYRNHLDSYVTLLEQYKHEVHYPPRDTNQKDKTGLGICKDNAKAMADADEVHVAWDGKSQGCLFDLGLAFAMEKRIIVIIGYFPQQTGGKSFASMVRAWEKDGKSHGL